ncbi:MAG TPA: ABC transporter ATP-binding protein [Chloroflexia bacterium]|nr:ABC transporter ATP-binding protein [Chloroflexia bacterium]
MITEENTSPQGPLTVRPVASNGQRNPSTIPPIAEPTVEVESPPIVTLQDVSKRFRNVEALRNVTVTIRAGQTYGFLGPTGAGKSTVLKVVMGWLHPDEGAVSVFGSPYPAGALEAHNSIGYLPEQPQFHNNFTGWEYLRLHARLSGLTRRNVRASAERAVETIGGHAWIKRRIGYYTGEMLQRLALGVALVGAGNAYPALLVLDEPSNRLDRAGQAAMRDILLECKRRGSTILMASHKVTEVERICDTVAIIKAGKLVTEAEVENNPRIIIIAIPRSGTDAETRLPSLVRQLKSLHPFVRITGGQNSGPLILSLPAGDQVINPQGVKARALRALVDAGWDVISVYVERKDLENIYAQTLSPITQTQTGPLSTGPLSLNTGPLGPSIESAATGPLTPLSVTREPLGGRFTGPLAEEYGEQNGAAGNGSEKLDK